jgi:hypothetical protein
MISYINNYLKITSKDDVLYYTDKKEFTSLDILIYCSYKAVSRVFPYKMDEFDIDYIKPLVDNIDTVISQNTYKQVDIKSLADKYKIVKQ